MSAVGVFKSIRFPFVALATALGLAFGSVFLTGCNDSQAAANTVAKPTEVGVVMLATQPLTLSTELSGRTTAFMVAQIRPQVGGIIQKRAFTEGAMVKAGELLYQIDPASYQAAYASARAAVSRAEATLGLRASLAWARRRYCRPRSARS